MEWRARPYKLHLKLTQRFCYSKCTLYSRVIIMNFLLSILLYLGSITSGQSYDIAQINALLAEQQAAISTVQQDQVLNQQVQTTYGEQAALIDILNRDQVR